MRECLLKTAVAHTGSVLRCCTDSSRGFQAWPLAWPSLSGPPGRQRLCAQGWVPKMLSAKRSLRSGWKGSSGALVGGGADMDNARRSRPGRLWPFIRQLAHQKPSWPARPARVARDPRRVTAGSALRRGAGERRGGGSGPRRCAPALEAAGRAAPPPAARIPPPWPLTARHSPAFVNVSPYMSCASCANMAGTGRRGAPKVRP